MQNFTNLLSVGAYDYGKDDWQFHTYLVERDQSLLS